MDHLEAGGFVAPERRGVADVARLALSRRVLEDDVGRLEDLDREGVRTVFADRLEQALEQRRPYDLEFERLRVRDPHRLRAVVFPVKPLKVLLVRALQYMVRQELMTTEALGTSPE